MSELPRPWQENLIATREANAEGMRISPPEPFQHCDAADVLACRGTPWVYETHVRASAFITRGGGELMIRVVLCDEHAHELFGGP